MILVWNGILSHIYLLPMVLILNILSPLKLKISAVPGIRKIKIPFPLCSKTGRDIESEARRKE